MSVHSAAGPFLRRAARPLLDVAAAVLVSDPAASLAEVAEAAGIGRTTLHKHYATREDLLRAVGHRAVDLWEQAVATVTTVTGDDAGLRDLIAAMIPNGPQLAFLWRTPAFDHDDEIQTRWRAAEARCLAVLKQAQDRGMLSAAAADWWLLQIFYALIYTAAESVQAGRLAPRDAPALVLNTFLHGIGASPQHHQPQQAQE
jgi:AcrR family transcriptional regulator